MSKIKTCAKHGIEYTYFCLSCKNEYQRDNYAKKSLDARQERRKAALEIPSLDVNASTQVILSTEQKEAPETHLTKKRCAKCKEPKLLDEFSKRKHTKDGREFRCKTCRNGENMARTERERVEGPKSDLHHGSNVITHRMEDSGHRHGTSKPAACAMSPLEWV